MTPAEVKDCATQFVAAESLIRRASLESKGKPFVFMSINTPAAEPMSATAISWAKAERLYRVFSKVVPATAWDSMKRATKEHPGFVASLTVMSFGNYVVFSLTLIDSNGPTCMNLGNFT
jgi:hypothetical protein